MKKLFFIDTNILLRFLTKDDNSKYEKCRDIFKKAMEGEIVLTTSAMVIAELIWTLLSYYKVPKADVIEKVLIIVGTESLHIPEKDTIMDALVLFGRKNIDYIDTYNAVFMRHHGLSEIYSYDEDFDAIEGIQRKEPYSLISSKFPSLLRVLSPSTSHFKVCWISPPGPSWKAGARSGSHGGIQAVYR